MPPGTPRGRRSRPQTERPAALRSGSGKTRSAAASASSHDTSAADLAIVKFQSDTAALPFNRPDRDRDREEPACRGKRRARRPGWNQAAQRLDKAWASARGTRAQGHRERHAERGGRNRSGNANERQRPQHDAENEEGERECQRHTAPARLRRRGASRSGAMRPGSRRWPRRCRRTPRGAATGCAGSRARRSGCRRAARTAGPRRRASRSRQVPRGRMPQSRVTHRLRCSSRGQAVAGRSRDKSISAIQTRRHERE